MKILHIFTYFQPDFTGEGVYFEKMNKCLLEREVQSHVLVVKTREPAGANLHHGLGGNITYLGLKEKGALKLAFEVVIWLAQNVRRYDAVHMHSQVDRYFAAALLCRLLGVVCFQSCTLDDSPNQIAITYNKMWRWLIKRLVRLVGVYISISPYLYNSALSLLPKKKVVFIPQGVQVPDLVGCAPLKIRERYGYGSDDIILLFVGGICVRKGVDVLIEGMPALVACNRNVRLLIVGPVLEEDYARDLEIRTVELGLQEHVGFAGPMNEVGDFYQLSDIMVFASHMEGFGNVLLEAMAFGMPVVSRRLPGVTDYFIEHNKTGYLFDNQQDYVDILKILIDNPDIQQAIGSAAREEVSKNFAMPMIAQRYIDLYSNKEA
jgi:glycosyltransferase involved in cell wall biosynthesis